jgi:hypothetical protein
MKALGWRRPVGPRAVSTSAGRRMEKTVRKMIWLAEPGESPNREGPDRATSNLCLARHQPVAGSALPIRRCAPSEWAPVPLRLAIVQPRRCALDVGSATASGLAPRRAEFFRPSVAGDGCATASSWLPHYQGRATPERDFLRCRSGRNRSGVVREASSIRDRQVAIARGRWFLPLPVLLFRRKSAGAPRIRGFLVSLEEPRLPASATNRGPVGGSGDRVRVLVNAAPGHVGRVGQSVARRSRVGRHCRCPFGR